MHPLSPRTSAALAATLALIAGVVPALGAPPPARAAVSYTAFTIDGEAGAPIGGGVPQVYTDADSNFNAADPGLPSTPGYVMLAVTGTSGAAAGHSYYIHLAAPPGVDLAVGTYTGATRAAFRGPGEPGIDIYGDGVGCNTVAGQFTVHEVSFSGPTLTSFSASYSFTCDALLSRMAGEVRYASALGFAGLRQLPASPTALDFGSSNIVGEPSSARTTELANAGTTPIAISAFGIGGANPGDYAQSAQTCGSSLSPGASCGWDTAFTATAPGYRYATAHFTSDSYGFVHGQTLAGYAAAAMPQLQVAPGAGKAFGTVTLGTSASQAFTLTSIGNAPVTMGTRSITGTDAPDFGITGDDCPAQLVPTATCTVTVRFLPLTTGSKSASLTITTTDAYSPYDLPLSGTVVLPSSGVAWGALRKPGPSYTWTSGGALGRTVRSGVQQLHLAYATDRIGSSWAKDTGPYAGVYYVRSTSGSTWTAPRRLNPTTQHAARLALAASGSRVYAAWVSQTKIVKYSPTAPRVLYVRVNTSHGDATGWRTTVRLSSTSGRVDYPAIAAYGNDVVIAWTDSVTGTVRAAISHDRGSTWKTVSLGSTTATTTSGRTGLPSAAVSGTTLAVSWLADAAGTVKTRVSADRGATWPAAVTTGSQASGATSTAVRGSRVAVAWATGSDVVVRLRLSGTWGTAISVAGVDTSGGAFEYAPAITLQDPARVGVAWSEQQAGDIPYAYQRWAESADNGTSWFATQTIATRTSTGANVNDWGSVLWPSASTRIVEWNGWTSNTTGYRQFLRTGTGAPATVAVAAGAWAPDPARGSSPTGRFTAPASRVTGRPVRH